MFLNQLKENEKELFLNLSAKAAMSDGNFELEEMETIARLCYEMMMPNHLPDTDMTLDEILSNLNEIATKAEKNIIIFELILLMKSDEQIEGDEMAYTANVAVKLGISVKKLMKFESLAERYYSLSGEITNEISG